MVGMKIAVIDGQGGGIGRLIVEGLRKELGNGVEIIALATNSMALSVMLKAGADKGATGENAILRNAHSVDIITGPIGIIIADSMMGELTPAMAHAISSSAACKVLLPLNRCGVEIIGVVEEPLPRQIEKLINRLSEIIRGVSL